MHNFAAALAVLLILCAITDRAGAESSSHSALWGEHGERWSDDSQLPDVSFAGYRHGDRLIPDYPVIANVRDFGAVGDGEADDTQAFRDAIAAADPGDEGGAVLVPAGTYRLTDIISLDKPNLVLRGQGPAATTLHFERSLEEIDPRPSQTGHGTATTHYAWSGGLLRIVGHDAGSELTTVAQPATRGDRIITVADAAALHVGQWIQIHMRDNDDATLAEHLYAGDPGSSDGMGIRRARLVAEIVAIDGQRVTLNRPLRFDIRDEWQPRVLAVEPTVTDSGIERLRITMPGVPYRGHFNEDGYNGVQFISVDHCWLRDVHIHNADSGAFINGRFCTIENLTLTADREADNGNHTGHHGLTLHNDDNLVIGADIQTRFIHDITVSGVAGNVISKSRGVDLALDHHRWAPYENVFTDIHAGRGSRVWRSGGTGNRGRHTAARATFWNIRADRPIGLPPDGWGPAPINLVAVEGLRPDDADNDQAWHVEPIAPANIQPTNIHEAQLERRR
ncbi:MAG: glycosyl hydrolase family 28-related protein [Phycisphaeraceae bacterium]